MKCSRTVAAAGSVTDYEGVDMDRLRARIVKNIIEDENGCWIWQRRKDRDGYGTMWIGSKPKRVLRFAHRISYELFADEIPEGLQIDHLCRVRSCVNPNHLEPVTPGENTRRSPWNSPHVCRRGHERTPESTYIMPSGHRACRICRAEAQRRYLERLAQQAP